MSSLSSSGALQASAGGTSYGVAVGAMYDPMANPSSSSRSLGSRPRRSKMGDSQGQSGSLEGYQAAKGSPKHVPSQPHPASPSSPSTTTLHDLPLELLGYIIRIAYPTRPPPGGEEENARRTFLRMTSLVCVDWTPFAQRELWKVVSLKTQDEMDQFIAAGPGRYPVLSLWMVPGLRDEHRRAKSILCGVHGVEELEMVGGTINSRWLCGPGLSGLKTLTLWNMTDVRLRRPNLRFHLRHLLLSGDLSRVANLLHTLSQQPSLTSLSAYSDAITLALFLPLAPQLLSFKATYTSNLDRFVSKCTQLKDLTLVGDCVEVISQLVVSLQVLSIRGVDEPCLETILDLFNDSEETKGLEGLERLTILVPVREGDEEDMSEMELRELALDEVEQWGRWQELKDRCQKKKIELIVDGER